MPDILTYPTAADLLALIETTGVIDVTEEKFRKINLGGKLDAAIAWWETKTGYHPYLAPSDSEGNPVETTRSFDAPDGGKELELRTGLLSASSVSVFGTAYLIGADAFLRPANAAANGDAYTSLRFLGRVSSRLPECIAITGVWGACTKLPGDVWEAILQKAAALCVPQLALNISQGVYERREGDEMVRFGGSGHSPLSAEAAQWQQFAQDTARDRKRITV